MRTLSPDFLLWQWKIRLTNPPLFTFQVTNGDKGTRKQKDRAKETNVSDIHCVVQGQQRERMCEKPHRNPHTQTDRRTDNRHPPDDLQLDVIIGRKRYPGPFEMICTELPRSCFRHILPMVPNVGNLVDGPCRQLSSCLVASVCLFRCCSHGHGDWFSFFRLLCDALHTTTQVKVGITLDDGRE
jgi:hypothetical protein